MKKSKNRKRHIKAPLSVILTLLLLFYWIWMFYATQPATERNTYTCSEKITNIEIKPVKREALRVLFCILTKMYICVIIISSNDISKAWELM